MKCTKSVKQIVEIELNKLRDYYIHYYYYIHHSQNFLGGVSGSLLKEFIGAINNEAYIHVVVREQQMCTHIQYFNTALLQYTIMQS